MWSMKIRAPGRSLGTTVVMPIHHCCVGRGQHWTIEHEAASPTYVVLSSPKANHTNGIWTISIASRWPSHKRNQKDNNRVQSLRCRNRWEPCQVEDRPSKPEDDSSKLIHGIHTKAHMQNHQFLTKKGIVLHFYRSLNLGSWLDNFTLDSSKKKLPQTEKPQSPWDPSKLRSHTMNDKKNPGGFHLIINIPFMYRVMQCFLLANKNDIT